MRTRPLLRIFAGALSALCVFAQAALADLSQSGLWETRRSARAAAPATLASLPLAFPPLGSAVAAPRLPRAGAAAASPLRRALDALPKDRVSVQRFADRGDRAPVIILQDVHLNAEAQRNIEAATSALIDARAIHSLHLEGAAGPVRLERFRAFPAATRRALADALLDAGGVGGPTAALVKAEGPIPAAVGADDQAAYDANAAAVATAARRRPDLSAALDRRGRENAEAKRRVFGPALARYDRLSAAHRGGQMTFGAYAAALAEMGLEPTPAVKRFLTAYRLEAAIDFARVEAERRSVLERLAQGLDAAEIQTLAERSLAFRAGRVGFAEFYAGLEALCRANGVVLDRVPAFRDYLRYVTVADSVDAAAVLSEFETGRAALVDRLATTPEEKAVARDDAALALAGKLVRFEMTPEDWAAWERDRAARALAGLDLSDFESFYRWADARTRALAASVDAPGGAPRLLVVGGFHTAALSALLTRKKTPHVVVSPRLTRVDGAASAYLDVFTREKTPLERLFAGEKLTLNPAGSIWGSSNERSRWSGANFLHRAAAVESAAGRALAPAAEMTAAAVSPNLWKTAGAGQAWVATGEAAGFDSVDAAPLAGTRVGTLRAPAAARALGTVKRALASIKSVATSGPPGAWALWQKPLNKLAPIIGEKWANKLRPLISGLGEGLIAGGVAAMFPGSITAMLLWFTFSFAMHYFTGVTWWNHELEQWDTRRYYRPVTANELRHPGEIRIFNHYVRIPDGPLLRANVIASISLLGFVAANFDAGLTQIFLLAVIPHTMANLTRERRIDEEKRRLLAEKQRKFKEASEIAAIADAPAPPSAEDREKLIQKVQERNDLASFLRFNEKTGVRYQLALIMQPGSTSEVEGPGFKALNDAIGYDRMNSVFPYRNARTWAIVQEEFADLAAQTGESVVVEAPEAAAEEIAKGPKSLRFAINLDALDRIYPYANARDADVERRMNNIIRRVSAEMLAHITVENANGQANQDIFNAVRVAQAKGKLPKRIESFPLYWGLSDEAVSGNIDDTLVLDAQVVAAVNSLRANPESVRALGRRFSLGDVRDNLVTLGSVRAALIQRGLLKARDGSPVERLPVDLADAFRKKKRPAIRKILETEYGVPKSESNRAYDQVRGYMSLLGTLDFIKPWVGSQEKIESLELAQQTNEVVARLRAMESMPADRAEKEWLALRPLLGTVLSKDPRAPFLGSQFEFFGRSVRQGRDEVGVLFVDFRGFGALILGEIELAAVRLAGIAATADNAGLSRAFAEETLTLGNHSLDPFAAALRGIRDDLVDRFGPDAGLHFYFGGDDVAVTMPGELLYPDKSKEPSPAVVGDIFKRVPPGMLVRVVAASSVPFLDKGPVMSVALAMSDADELAEEAKKAEASWKPRGKKAEQVVTFSDRSGAHYKAPVWNGVVARAELEHPGFDDNGTWVVKQLMWLHKRFNRHADDAEARHWAEVKTEDSIILFSVLVAAFELPLIPGMSVLLNNYTGPYLAIIVGAFLMILFHEGTILASWINRNFRRYVLRRSVQRKPPPGSWVDWLGVRIVARFAASLVILFIAFLPLYKVMNAESMLLFDSWEPFIPSFGGAWMTHAMWNAFVPPSWRLSLLKMPKGGATRANPNHPRENQDTPLSINFPKLGVRIRAVFDGFGGSKIGRIASRWAARAARRRMNLDLKRLKDVAQLTDDDVLRAMRNALLSGTVEVFRRVVSGTPDSGSTASIALKRGNRLFIGQAGDAGSYLFVETVDGDVSLSKITLDNLEEKDIPSAYVKSDLQGPWAALIDRDQPLEAPLDEVAALQQDLAELEVLAGTDRKTLSAFLKRNVVKNTVGRIDLFPVVFAVTIPTGKRVWLIQVSDGPIDNLTPDRMRDIIAAAATPEEASAALVAASHAQMRTVDRARGPMKTILDFYDDIAMLPPGDEDELKKIHADFANGSPRAPAYRPAGDWIVTWYWSALRDVIRWSPRPQAVNDAIDELEKLSEEPGFARAKPDDAVALATDLQEPLDAPAMASIFDGWMRRTFGAAHPFYRFYSLVLVHWELAFFLPAALLIGVDGGLTASLVAAAVGVGAFVAAHPDRTAAERWELFGIAVLVAASWMAGVVLFDGSWTALIAPVALHAANNGRVLAALSRESRQIERLQRFAADDGASRAALVELAASLPLKLGVENLDRPVAPAARAVADHIERNLPRWVRDGLLSASDATALERRTGERLRTLLSDRNENGLTAGTERALGGRFKREAEAGAETGRESIVYRYIRESSPEAALVQARKAASAYAGAKGVRLALVVEGPGTEALEKEFGAGTPVIRGSEADSMRALEERTARWLAREGGMTGREAAERLKAATFRLIVPDDVRLPAGFMDGIADLDRYQIYVLVRAALLAVQVRPDRLDDMAVIAAIVARQA